MSKCVDKNTHADRLAGSAAGGFTGEAAVLDVPSSSAGFRGGPAMSDRLVSRPRPDGRHYDVEHQGALLASASDDAEHNVARVPVARAGILSTGVIFDGNTGIPRLRFDVSICARMRTVERSAGGVTTEPWRPMPSASSHGGATKRFSKAGEEKVADQAANAPVAHRGRPA